VALGSLYKELVAQDDQWMEGSAVIEMHVFDRIYTCIFFNDRVRQLHSLVIEIYVFDRIYIFF
jgi:hypothetical protein